MMAAEAEATRDARAKVVFDDEKLLLFQLGPEPIQFETIFLHFHDAGAKRVEVA